jgi:hypothetical protein
MTGRLRRWLILLLIGYGSAHAAPLRYLGDIELGMPGVTRTSVRFGRARAVLARDGSISFQGQDHEGKPWKAALDVEEGVGLTTIW